MMMSIGCALSEAVALNRTLLLPAEICVPRKHQRTGFFAKRDHQACSPMADIIDIALLSRLTPVAIYDPRRGVLADIPPSRVAWVNQNCPTSQAAQHYTCAGGAWLLRRFLMGGGYLFDQCLHSQTATSTQLVDRAFAGLGATLEAAFLAGGGKPSLSWWEKRAASMLLLQRGWFWSRALKDAAVQMRTQIGEPFVSVHIRRGDRLGKQSRVRDWKSAKAADLTQAPAIFEQLARWFPRRTAVVISSNEPREFFAHAAASSTHRVFTADNFSALLTRAGISNNNQLFALEILLSQGATSQVETFEVDASKARMACAFFRWMENTTTCAGRAPGAIVQRGSGHGPITVALRCSEDGRARVSEINGVAEGACPGLWLVNASSGGTSGRRLETAWTRDDASMVSCHGTSLRLTRRTPAENAAAQLVLNGIVSPELGAHSLVHFWRTLGRPRRAGHAALCAKQAAWHVLTFGSHGKYERAARQVCQIALRAGADSCSSSTLEDLPADWRAANGVTNASRGLGHWKWKPFVILRRLRELADGDVMLYVDRDLRLGKNLSALFCLGQNAAKGLACFHQACYTERAWTSHELVTALGAGRAELESVQVNGGLQVWRRSEATLALAEQYLSLTERFARGPVNRSVELAHNRAYREHRHDQSCCTPIPGRSNPRLCKPAPG